MLNLLIIKKRVKAREKRTGLQLPVGSSSFNSDDNVSQNNIVVNSNDMQNISKKSLDVDSEDNKLCEQQQEYFKNSKVRDENGNLIVVYYSDTNDLIAFAYPL
jgi:hypothetical protein